MRITIHRSRDWLVAERLASGESIPDSIDVDVETKELDMEARALLLEMGGGQYPREVPFVGYYEDGRIAARYVGWGRVNIVVNSHAPTVAEISVAIIAAVSDLRAKVAALAAERAEREAEHERLAAEKAARQQQLADARALLADELAALTAARDGYRADAELLGHFASLVPDDALRAAVKRLARDLAESGDDLRERIERASPTHTVFAATH